jgi:hypothetical protein
LTQPKYATQDKNGKRLYRDPRNPKKRVPSVTTVIGMKAKPLLVGWAARTAAEYADENWQMLSNLSSYERVNLIKNAHTKRASDAADLGDSIHLFAEAYLKDEPMPAYPVEAQYSIANLIAWIDLYKPKLIAAEVSKISDHGYAGTFDLLAEIDGEVWLLDWKTGKGVYDEVGMQLAALHFADRVLAEEPTILPKATRFGVVHIRPDSVVEEMLIEFEDMDGYFEMFKACLTLYKGSK